MGEESFRRVNGMHHVRAARNKINKKRGDEMLLSFGNSTFMAIMMWCYDMIEKRPWILAVFAMMLLTGAYLMLTGKMAIGAALAIPGAIVVGIALYLFIVSNEK